MEDAYGDEPTDGPGRVHDIARHDRSSHRRVAITIEVVANGSRAPQARVTSNPPPSIARDSRRVERTGAYSIGRACVAGAAIR